MLWQQYLRQISNIKPLNIDLKEGGKTLKKSKY